MVSWGLQRESRHVQVLGLRTRAIVAALTCVLSVATSCQGQAVRREQSKPSTKAEDKVPGGANKRAVDPARISVLIEALRDTKIDQTNEWGYAVRELTGIGKPAVPALIKELDSTTENMPMRALGFTLRAIGDPRAVPALIRAIPRTLFPPRSDYGATCEDPELLKFLQKHDLKEGKRPKAFESQFTFGRPFREVTGTLKSITGQQFNEMELNFVHLGGGAKQRQTQSYYFHKLAERWALWWEANWRRFTDNDAYSKVNLPAGPVLPKPSEQLFPVGEKVKSEGSTSGMILGPPQDGKYYVTFMDLDTGRNLQWPKELGEPGKAKAEEVTAWAAREGYDLQGIDYKVPGVDTKFYAIRGLGLRAWQVDNGHFDKIDGELRQGPPPELLRPANDLLMDFDAKSMSHVPANKATFLFQTREGTTGILQVTSQITDLFDETDIGKRADQTRPHRGFSRGVQFQHKMIYEDE
jgi:hypothetical protein